MKRGARPAGPNIGRCTSTTTTAEDGGKSSAAFFFFEDDESELEEDVVPPVLSFFEGLAAFATSPSAPAFALTYSFKSLFASATVAEDGPRRAPA